MAGKLRIMGLGLLPFAAVAVAGTPAHEIHLNVRQTYHVANTVMVARMQASASGQSAPELAPVVNQKVHWALQQADKVKNIQAQSVAYSTQRHYVDGKPGAWSVEQTIRFSGPQSSLFDQLLGHLQSRLELVSLQAEPASAARDKAETVAARQAIQHFRERASNACKAFGYAKSELNSVQINDLRTPLTPALRMMTVGTAVNSTPGESSLSVEVSGSVQCIADH